MISILGFEHETLTSTDCTDDSLPPLTFFGMVSSAEKNYLPELHKLMPHSESSKTTNSIRVHTVIDNPYITDWFFASKMSIWVQHWLYDVLGAEWHKMLYDEDHQPPVLPTDILVDFDRYARPAFIAHRPQCVMWSLMSDPFSMTYTPNNVINAVYHNKSVDRWPPTLHHLHQTSAFFLKHFA